MHQAHDIEQAYDLAARDYAARFFGELERKPLDRLLLTRFAERVANASRVADLGCGCGHTTRFLAEHGVEDLVGVDYSRGMVTVARERSPHVEFVHGNMLALDMPDASLGAILAMYAIVHFDDSEIASAFREFRRVLAPHAEVLLSFHTGEGEVRLTEFLGHETPLTFYYLDVDRVLEIAAQAEFDAAETVIRYPYPDVEFPSRRAYVTLKRR
ncbi:MAG: class I SAM-dependent methyltransferase [Planctomycetes bacterium]|nr:class I SAM-dependent methyltransferase [Planctomycetota bacterium]